MKRRVFILIIFIPILFGPIYGKDNVEQQKCRIIKTVGKSLYWLKNKVEWKKLNKATLLTTGHTIKTSEDAELHISFEPAITAVLSKNSLLTFDKLLINHKQKAIRMRQNFQKGQIDIKMPSNMGYTLLFTISTPTASIYIANADFKVIVEQNNATILEVFRGSVKLLQNENENKSIVYAGTRAVVLPGQPEINITNLVDKLDTPVKKQQKPVSVAILSIYSRKVPKDNLEPLSDYVAQEIEKKQPNTEVFFLDDVRAMLRAEGIQHLLNCNTDSCISKIGSFLGVDLVVIGRLGQLGNRFIFNLKMIDALRDVTKNRASVVVDNDIGIVFNQVPSLVDTLIKGQIVPEPVTYTPEKDSIIFQKIHKEMVWIFPGTFYMGSAEKTGEIDELPQHKVTLNGFYIDKYEITKEEFERVMGYNPSKFKGCKSCPVDNVS